MAYCINPDCSRRKNPDNFAVCQNCKTPLILQNRYRLRHPLQVDTGIYTEVFEIEDLVNPDQPKVLKSLKEVSPELERLFQQEASILTTLRHPGLPVGEAMFPLVLNTGRQLRCFVMEKIPGENLQVWLSNNQYLTSYKTALDWLKQITNILQFVHKQKFFHRDIKPGNIMLRPDGKLVLIDFGTARKLTQTIINGKPVTVIQSIGYTAPEQLEGHAVVQSDFYALGRTLIYLLTGIDPAGDRQENLRNWSKYVKDQKTPKRLIELIQAMTASRAQHRPATAQAILNQIAQVEKPPYAKWQKLLLTITSSVFLFWIGQKLYREITIARTCDQILNDYLSCGEESLIPKSFWGNGLPPPAKQLGIVKYRQKNFAAAVALFEKAFRQEADAETLIYLNNAKIKNKFPAEQIYTIAVAVPLEHRTDIGIEILRGVAQAQTEALQKGQPLRIIIADDSNGNGKIAQHLVKYRDLLAVLGHYSSEATKQALPIYRQAGVVLISATSTSARLNSPFFFRTVPSDRITSQKIASYVFSELNQRQAAIFYSQGSEYAESLASAFREAAKSSQGKVINHQSAFNLASDRFDAKTALNQAKTQGASAIVLIPDAGVGLHNAIPNALQVMQSNVNKAWIVAGDSLYSSSLLKSDQVLSPEVIKHTAWAIPWHPMKDPNSVFVKQAQTLWRIDRQTFPSNIDITWRTATSYDAALVLSQAITLKPTRLGIQQTLSHIQVTGATGVIRFQGSDRHSGKITIMTIQPNCNSSGFVFMPSDRPLKCQERF
jgi:eukaryotic-like serine/threonine-protein kinase